MVIMISWYHKIYTTSLPFEEEILGSIPSNGFIKLVICGCFFHDSDSDYWQVIGLDGKASHSEGMAFFSFFLFFFFLLNIF